MNLRKDMRENNEGEVKSLKELKNNEPWGQREPWVQRLGQHSLVLGFLLFSLMSLFSIFGSYFSFTRGSFSFTHRILSSLLFIFLSALLLIYYFLILLPRALYLYSSVPVFTLLYQIEDYKITIYQMRIIKPTVARQSYPQLIRLSF